MSRDYRDKKVVIWPAYIDSTISRKDGRRIPREQAVSNPTIEEIVNVADELGLNPIVEEAPYPRLWWKYKARVVVDKKYPKQKLLRIIASKIREIRNRKS